MSSKNLTTMPAALNKARLTLYEDKIWALIPKEVLNFGGCLAFQEKLGSLHALFPSCLLSLY